MNFQYFCLPGKTYDNINKMIDPVRNFYRKDKNPSEVEMKLGDLVQALALCHNVTPFNKGGKFEFEAASPDEKTLVEIA